MNYLKLTQYVYLIFAGFFIYDGVNKMNDPDSGYALSFVIAAVAIFMFFFRRHFAKKFADRDKNK